MTEKYIITFDLDGTLLNHERKITYKTRKCLQRLHKDGHILVISTGRIFDGCFAILKELDVFDYLVTDSGSLIYDVRLEKTIYKKKLTRNNIKKLIDLYNEKTEYIEFSDEHFYYKYSKNELNHYGLSKSIININEFIKKNNAIHSTIKLFDYDDNYRIIELIMKENSNLGAFETINSDGQNKWIEIVLKGISKFQALKIISRRECISMENTISFGDSYNDFEMLIKSKYGVAMENAIDELKNNASYITKSCDEDGIEKFLREFFYEND